MDLYLKFDNLAHMIHVLRDLSLTYTDEHGTEHVSSGGHDHAIWEVGEIPGTNGWHVNMRIISDTFDWSALEPYQVIPRQPRVVWA